MKKRNALLATVLAAAVVTCSMPLTAAAADTTTPYVESDTTMNFMVEQGKTYTFKMTVHGTHANPNIAMGNGAVFQTRDVKKVVENGNDVYYFKVLATGKEGEATGVYTTLPGQQPVKHAVAVIPYLAPDMGTNGSLNIAHAKTYQVGKDIPAGEYAIFPIAPTYHADCQVYNADGSNPLSDIADGKNVRHYLTVHDGQKVMIVSAAMVAVQNVARALPNAQGQLGIGSSFYDVQYKCGLDLQPGTYTVVHDPTRYGDGSVINESKAYIYDSSSSDFSQGDKSVSSLTFTGSTQITLKAGQYLDLYRAYVQLS